MVIEQATGTRSPCGQAQCAEEIGVGEVGGLEDLMDEGADPGPAGKLTERKKAAEQTGVVRHVHSGRDVGLVDLGPLADLSGLRGLGRLRDRHPGVMGGRGQAAVGGSRPVRINYLNHYTWHRVVGWLRRKHRRVTWKSLRQRYLANRLVPEHDGVSLFNAGAVPIIRYRYRGTRIPSPWDGWIKSTAEG